MQSTSLKTRRIQAILNDRPLPMTIREAKEFRKMVFDFIHADIRTARIKAADQDDTVLAKIDRVESYAFADILESYRGER